MGVGVTEGRIYGGQTPADRAAARRARLLDAGLQVLGTPDLGPVTVRKVIDESGLAPRYFYDHFTDLDQLQLAVFDQLITEAEHLAKLAMVTAAPRSRDRIRAVLEAMVDLMLDDPRKGRVLLMQPATSPVLGPRFHAEVQRFADLLARYSPAAWRGADPHSRPVRVTAQFAIGGFTAALTAVLADGVPVDRRLLVDDLTMLFIGLGTAFHNLDHTR